MQFKKFVNLCIILFLLTSSFLIIVETSSADDTQDDIVYAYLDVTFETPIALRLNVSLDVSKITIGTGVPGYSYDKEGIADLWNDTSIPNDDRGKITQKLETDLIDQIEPLFIDLDNAEIKELHADIPYDKNSSRFTKSFTINLTSSFFGLNTISDLEELATGLLDKKMGIILKYSFDFNAKPGWSNSFTFDLTKSPYTTTDVTSRIDGKEYETVHFPKNNTEGEQTISEINDIYLKNQNVINNYNEDIFLNYHLDSSDVDKNKLEISMIYKNISIRKKYIYPGLSPNCGLSVKERLLKLEQASF